MIRNFVQQLVLCMGAIGSLYAVIDFVGATHEGHTSAGNTENITINMPPACSGSPDTIAGFAWEDFNFNGIKDANENFGIQGLIVMIYDEDCNQVGTNDTTDIEGNWAIDVSSSASPLFRVEYTNLPSWASETSNGTDGNTLVQFVAAGDCANLGVGDPNRFAGDGSSVVTTLSPCHVNGDPLGGGNSGMDDWYVGYPYGSSGNGAPPRTLNGQVIGTTFGQSYSQQAQQIFLGAFLRRHSGLGVLGSGGIYLLEPTATSFNVTQFYDLDANGIRTRADAGTAPAYGDGSSYQLDVSGEIVTYLGAVDPLTGEPSGLGVIGVNGAGGRNLPGGSGTANADPAAFDQVGKVGLGDLELSDDGRFLFVMNLYSRSVVRLELDDPVNPTAVVGTQVWNIDDIPSVPTCEDGTLRPFGFSFYRDKLYIGAVCTNEDTTRSIPNNPKLEAHVFELNDPKGMGIFTTGPIVSQTLDFNKGQSRGSQAAAFQNNTWNSWTNDFGSAFGDYPINNVYPTPWLTDIEFTDYGNMVLLFADRAGYQYGNANNDLQGNGSFSYQIGGHMLFAERLADGTYQVESGGQTPNFGVDASIRLNGEGPGGGEFFSGAFFTSGNNDSFPPNPFVGNHPSVPMGSGAVFPGTDEISITSMDPTSLFSGGSLRLSASNGSKTIGSGYRLYAGGGPTEFGKASGLGDLETSMQGDVPIEIGNYVWEDANNNGKQDPGEIPIDGLPVTLWVSDGMGGFTQIAATNTVNGVYGFSNLTSGTTAGVAYNVVELLPDSTYELRFPTSDGLLSISTMPDNGGLDAGADLRDSDADANGVIAFSTMGAGMSNLNFDVGYFALEPVFVGDTTFVDVNANGIQDAGDQALVNVTVRLYDATADTLVTVDINGNPISGIMMTDINGFYLFDSLAPGDYYVTFDLTSVTDFEVLDFTQVNVNANGLDAIDSDADTLVTMNPDSARSQSTGLIPSGDSILTLDAGVVCIAEVEAGIGVTSCNNTDVVLSILAPAVLPTSLTAIWSTSGTGSFDDTDFNTGTIYSPSAGDIAAGEVTLTLTADAGTICGMIMDTVVIRFLNVDCGTFPWEGN